MCGLAYAHNFNGLPVNNEILQRFDEQRHRGTKGFGLFDGKKHNIVRATKENKILNWLVKYDSDLILFHHREPSFASIGNIKPGAHPYTTDKFYGGNQYILVHNGHIDNSYSLLNEHKTQGIKYRSLQPNKQYNDSESLLWDFASSMEKGDFSLKAYGAIAFICIKIHDGKLDKMYFGRNNQRPLVFDKKEDTIVLSSEGAGDLIEPNVLYTWHYKSKRLSKKDFLIPSSPPYSPLPYSEDSASVGDVISAENMRWFKRKRVKLLQADNQIKQDNILEEMETYSPEPSEIQVMAFEYLNICEGNFETAHYCIEADYIELESEAEFLGDYRKLRVMELSMSLLENDPEYINVNSVSSYWIKNKGAYEPLQLGL